MSGFDIFVLGALLGYIATSVGFCATRLREIRDELRKLNGKVER